MQAAATEPPLAINRTHTMQTATQYPIARSSSDHDIIHAARQRAKFWQYPPEGPWIVPVIVGKRTVTVYAYPNQDPVISRGGAR